MKILTKLSDYVEKSESNENALQTILSVLSDSYNERVDDDEAYLSKDFVSPGDAVFGKDEPDKLKSIALLWNEDIFSELISALRAFMFSCGTTVDMLNPDAIMRDSHELYRLKKAVIAADNDWYDFAAQMTYLDNPSGCPCFWPLLNQNHLDDILTHPEDYIIVEVPTK